LRSGSIGDCDLAIGGICVTFYDCSSSVGNCGDAVLLVAMIIAQASAAAARDWIVDVAGINVGVGRSGRCRAGRVVGDGLLAVLEVDDVGCAVVAADSAPEGVELVKDVVDAVVIGVGGDQFVLKIPTEA